MKIRGEFYILLLFVENAQKYKKVGKIIDFFGIL